MRFEDGLCAFSFLFFLFWLIFQSSSDHFTWWGLFVTMVFDVCYGVGRYFGTEARVVSRVWLIAWTCEVVIVIGVLFMSTLGCTALPTTAGEVGYVYYTLGNYSVHYFPLTRLFLSMPRTLVRGFRQVGEGASVVVVYVLWLRPSQVYGCETGRFLTVSGLLFPLLLIAGFIFIVQSRS